MNRLMKHRAPEVATSYEWLVRWMAWPLLLLLLCASCAPSQNVTAPKPFALPAPGEVDDSPPPGGETGWTVGLESDAEAVYIRIDGPAPKFALGTFFSWENISGQPGFVDYACAPSPPLGTMQTIQMVQAAQSRMGATQASYVSPAPTGNGRWVALKFRGLFYNPGVVRVRLIAVGDYPFVFTDPSTVVHPAFARDTLTFVMP